MREYLDAGLVVTGAPPMNGQACTFFCSGNDVECAWRRSSVPERVIASMEPLGEPQAEVPSGAKMGLLVKILPILGNSNFTDFLLCSSTIEVLLDVEVVFLRWKVVDSGGWCRLQKVEQLVVHAMSFGVIFIEDFRDLLLLLLVVLNSCWIVSGLRKSVVPKPFGNLSLSWATHFEPRWLLFVAFAIHLLLSKEGCHQSFSFSSSSLLHRWWLVGLHQKSTITIIILHLACTLFVLFFLSMFNKYHCHAPHVPRDLSIYYLVAIS